jgi:hypothetical protein
MVFVPTSKGMVGTFHCAVPVALPEAPVELDHVSEVTPAVAVPLNAMVAVDVETMVIAGEVMVSDGGPAGGVVTGGVVTGGVVTGGVVTGGVEAWRVTAID